MIQKVVVINHCWRGALLHVQTCVFAWNLLLYSKKWLLGANGIVVAYLNVFKPVVGVHPNEPVGKDCVDISVSSC